MARRSLRSSVPTRHTTGIERPRWVDRLPSHISKMVVSTVSGGGPDLTAGSTIFELLVALCTPRICNSTIMIGRCRWGEYFQCPRNLQLTRRGVGARETSKRYREAASPLARIRAALNSLWLAHPPSFEQTNFGMTHVVGSAG